MTENEQYSLAWQVASNAHKGQTRRDGLTPYIQHIYKVHSILVTRNIIKKGVHRNIIDEIVSILHDTVEDTKITLQDLHDKGFSNIVIDAVDALTHRKGESYEDAILRAKANPIARKVKIADNLANLSDTPTDKQILKYTKSLQVLLAD